MQYRTFFNRLTQALVVLISAIFISTSHAATSLEKYQDIVVSSKAPKPVLLAAKDLQHHLNKITGRQVPLVNRKSDAANTLHFYVGSGFWPEQDARAEKLGSEGYLLVSVADGLLLTGSEGNAATGVADGSGVYHAVSLFLEEQCGVDWLWPGESGEVIPRNPQLTIPQLDRSGTPVLRRHHVKYYTAYAWTPERRAEIETWQRRTRQGDSMAAGFGHSWHTVLDENLYFKDHPEWYALVNGKRTFAQICPSNMEMRDEFMKRLLSIPGNQSLQILSVSHSDGYGFCECQLCRAKSADQQTYPEYNTAKDKAGSDAAGQIAGYQGFQHAAYWDFVVDMAKRLKAVRPDLGIGSFAYTMERTPPKSIERLPDNVYINMTYSASQFMKSGEEKTFTDFVNAWKAKGVKQVMYEYWGMWYWMDLPVLYPREIAKGIKNAHAAGTVGIYGEAGKNFSTQALNYYVCTRQLWDPQGADADKSMAKFYSAFGPAANDVRNYHEAFYENVRRVWDKKALLPSYVRIVASYDEMFDTQTLKRAKAALDAADAKATNDPILQKRLAFLRIGYDYTEVMAELLGLYEKLGRTGFPLEFFEWQSTAAPGRKVTNNTEFADRREFFEANLRQPFNYTLAQQDEWLRRAWELGEKRIQMLNANRDNLALEEGQYANSIQKGDPMWHSIVAEYLGKSKTDITPLIFNPRKSRQATPPAAASTVATKPAG